MTIGDVSVVPIFVENLERMRFVQAALAYIGTPYHHHGQVKGHGVDCATLLVCAARDAGLVEDFRLPQYSSQWHLNRTGQQYLATISRVCVEVPPPPQPGDVIIFQFGHTFSHGAIVVDWPNIVHARLNTPVMVDDVSKCPWLQFMGESNNRPRPYKLMSFWKR